MSYIPLHLYPTSAYPGLQTPHKGPYQNLSNNEQNNRIGYIRKITTRYIRLHHQHRFGLYKPLDCSIRKTHTFHLIANIHPGSRKIFSGNGCREMQERKEKDEKVTWATMLVLPAHVAPLGHSLHAVGSSGVPYHPKNTMLRLLTITLLTFPCFSFKFTWHAHALIRASRGNFSTSVLGVGALRARLRHSRKIGVLGAENSFVSPENKQKRGKDRILEAQSLRYNCHSHRLGRTHYQEAGNILDCTHTRTDHSQIDSGYYEKSQNNIEIGLVGQLFLFVHHKGNRKIENRMCDIRDNL